jgi:hypothetical protein
VCVCVYVCVCVLPCLVLCHIRTYYIYIYILGCSAGPQKFLNICLSVYIKKAIEFIYNYYVCTHTMRVVDYERRGCDSIFILVSAAMT